MEQMRKRYFISLLFVFTLSVACYWDTDTLLMERKQFPHTLELITGMFLQHGPEFYHWRIQDRERKVEQFPDSLSLFDDLAVAYDKVGDHERAILTAQLTELKAPERYETCANLGTFYLHNGQFPKGIQYLQKAIKINPDAHFGRERFQVYLAEYLLSLGQTDTFWLPLNINKYRYQNKPGYHVNQRMVEPDTVINEITQYRFRPSKKSDLNFYEFVLRKYHERTGERPGRLPEAELQAALEGIGGMIKFGQLGSPVLLDVMGELLAADQSKMAARRMGALAFLRAGKLSGSKAISNAYQTKAALLLELAELPGERTLGISELERFLDTEVRRADAYRDAMRADETCWIARGIDPEVAFAKKYYFEKAIRKVELERNLKSVRSGEPAELNRYLNRPLNQFRFAPQPKEKGGLYPSVEKLLTQRDESFVYQPYSASDSLAGDCVWVQEVRQALGGQLNAESPGRGQRSLSWLMVLSVLGGLGYFLWDWRRNPLKKQ